MAKEESADVVERWSRVANVAAAGSIRAWLRMAAGACGGRSAFVVDHRADELRVSFVGEPPSRESVTTLRRSAKARGVSHGTFAREAVTVVVVDPSADDDGEARGELLDGIATVLAAEMERPTSSPAEDEPVSRTTVAASRDGLRRSEASFRALVEQAPDGMAVHRDGRIVYANRAFGALFARSARELVGTALLDLIHPDDRPAFVDRQRTLEQQREVGTRRVRGLRDDGQTVDLDITGLPVLFDDAPAALSVVRDLTGTLRLERQVLASERMASVGTLAAGVAHELNNPLSYVVTNLEYARSEVASIIARDAQAGSFREMLRALEEAEKGAERVRQIVQGLRTFARVEDDGRGLVDVQRTLGLALDVAANEIRHRAHVRRVYKPVPRVEANEARLGQVFVNLLVNAAQAIPEGSAREHEIMVATYVDRQGRVAIEIGDSGCGMARDVLERAFEPFFTTKPVGVGTGLGLSVARNVVRSLGGEIDVDSMLGVGTIVRVVLPRAEESHRPATAYPDAPPAPHRARVLVVDDEPMIGTSIRRILARHHDIEHTTRAIEALEKIRTGTRYDAILCDLMMPELTGMDVYEALATEFPDQAARMIFLTGGTFTERARAFVEARPHRIASKPFKAQQLRDMIASLLVG